MTFLRVGASRRESARKAGRDSSGTAAPPSAATVSTTAGCVPQEPGNAEPGPREPGLQPTARLRQRALLVRDCHRRRTAVRRGGLQRGGTGCERARIVETGDAADVQGPVAQG